MLNFKDASDFKGRTVSQNLYNQVVNMDALAGVKDINVAWHFNAFNASATGAEVWYWLGDPVGYAIAKKLSAAIAKSLGIVDRGPKATTNLYVIARSKGITILPEVCFIDNKSDMQKYQAKKQKMFQACIDVFKSFPQYNFKSTHGGHYGLNMMDPGAVGNGYKEAVVAQEVNKAMLSLQSGGTTKPPVTETKPPVSTNKNPVTNGKVGDKVKVFDALYADSFGRGRSTVKKGATGVIKDLNPGGTKKYLVENWGWAGPNDIELVKANSFNINNYHTKKFAQIRVIKADYAYKEVSLKTKVGKIVPKGTVLTVVGIKYSGEYPRFELKSGLFMTTRKDTVEEYKPATKPPVVAPKGWQNKNGTFVLSTPILARRLPGKTTAPTLKLPNPWTFVKGDVIKYDGIIQSDGYEWIRQKRSNGYWAIPIGPVKNGKRTETWGTLR